MKENKISTKKQVMGIAVMCTFNPYDDDDDEDDDDMMMMMMKLYWMHLIEWLDVKYPC